MMEGKIYLLRIKKSPENRADTTDIKKIYLFASSAALSAASFASSVAC
jgi:hypothetical protein